MISFFSILRLCQTCIIHAVDTLLDGRTALIRRGRGTTTTIEEVMVRYIKRK